MSILLKVFKPRLHNILERSQSSITKLYEIPVCSVCLEELTSDVVSLPCGHCFHYSCINQHLNYRRFCPNCQQKVKVKKLRKVIFPLIQNTKTNIQLKSLLYFSQLSERRQLEQLLQEIKMQWSKLEKLRGSICGNDKKMKLQSEVIENLRKQNIEHASNISLLEMRLKESMKREECLSLQLERYQKLDEKYQTFLEHQDLVRDNAQAIVAYKEELENKNTSPAYMVSVFYEMLLLKNLAWMNEREKVKLIQQKLDEKCNQLKQHEIMVAIMRRELKNSGDKSIFKSGKEGKVIEKFSLELRQIETRQQSIIQEVKIYKQAVTPHKKLANGKIKRINTLQQNRVRKILINILRAVNFDTIVIN